MGGWIQDRVTREFASRKARVSEGLGAVAEAVRRVGQPLHEDPFSRLGSYADEAARTIDQVATGLRERDIDELADDVRGFARRRPGIFIGAGLVAGMVAGRFFRSSVDEPAGEGPARRAGARGRAGERTARPAAGERARGMARSI